LEVQCWRVDYAISDGHPQPERAGNQQHQADHDANHKSLPQVLKAHMLLRIETSRLTLWWMPIAPCPVPYLFLEELAQPGQIGKASPLAAARFLQRCPPDWMSIVAIGLPQTQEVDTIPRRFGHRTHQCNNARLPVGVGARLT
jgi:hypothetical protein